MFTLCNRLSFFLYIFQQHIVSISVALLIMLHSFLHKWVPFLDKCEVVWPTCEHEYGYKNKIYIFIKEYIYKKKAWKLSLNVTFLIIWL